MKYVIPAMAVLGAGLSAFSDPIQGLIMAHPAYAGVFAGLAALAGAFAPQPHK